jgi:putative transposase
MAPNHRWSLDPVSDQLTGGRRFRILTVVNDCTRACLTVVAENSLTGISVPRELVRLGDCARQTEDGGQRQRLRSILIWADQNWSRHGIAPSKPMQNAFIESFNGRLRGEL